MSIGSLQVNLILSRGLRNRMENFNHHPRVLMLNGPPRSGKDSVAAALAAKDNSVIRVSLAAPLKLAVHHTFNVPDKSVEAYELSKDEPNEHFFGDSPRQAYIKFSETYMKPNYGNDVWVKLAIRYAQQQVVAKAFTGILNPVIVFTDIGFIEEVNGILNEYQLNNCGLVRLSRQGTSFMNDSRSYIEHPSLCSFDIENTDGCLDDTIRRVYGIFQFLKDGRLYDYFDDEEVTR